MLSQVVEVAVLARLRVQLGLCSRGRGCAGGVGRACSPRGCARRVVRLYQRGGACRVRLRVRACVRCLAGCVLAPPLCQARWGGL